jgi:hypothetical protein
VRTRRRITQLTLAGIDANLARVIEPGDFDTHLPKAYLRTLPFGEQLADLAYDPKYGEANDHVRKVVAYANKLIAPGPHSLLPPGAPPSSSFPK